MAKKKAAPKAKALTKTEILNLLAERTELSKKDVGLVIEELTNLIGEELSNKKGARTFNLPGLVKIFVQHKPATKERQAISPFTKEMTTYAAKPAHDVVKVRALKALRDMA